MLGLHFNSVKKQLPQSSDDSDELEDEFVHQRLEDQMQNLTLQFQPSKKEHEKCSNMLKSEYTSPHFFQHSKTNKTSYWNLEYLQVILSIP